jgi:hypothetical protein
LLESTSSSAHQLAVLHERRGFIWAFVGESAWATAMTALTVLTVGGEDQRRFQAVQSELEELRADHAALMQTCEGQRESIERRSAVISRFKGETREIDALREECKQQGDQMRKIRAHYSWTTRQFAVDQWNRFNEIIAHLSRECCDGKNVHDCGVVIITLSSIGEPSRKARNAADFNSG